MDARKHVVPTTYFNKETRMTLIFWLTNMVFIGIITTLFYYIGWWAVPLMVMIMSTVASLVMHFVNPTQ